MVWYVLCFELDSPGLKNMQGFLTRIQSDNVSHTSQHVSISSTEAVVGATPGVANPTTTQMTVKSLKSIRDDLTSLLREASPVEAHRLRKIIDDLNAGIPAVLVIALSKFHCTYNKIVNLVWVHCRM